MKVSSERMNRAVLWSASGALTAAMIVAGSAAQAAHPTPQANQGPGYPAPKGIYKPFTDCPLLDQLMRESTPAFGTGCVAGVVIGGEIKIGNIVTKVRATAKVKVPVAVQFGIWDPPNDPGDNPILGGILPPPDGLTAQLISAPQHIPGGLMKALGCPSSNKTVQALCAEIPDSKKNAPLYASAESAGQITNFQLTSWTQPLKFHLMNPLLGPNCYVGSDDDPVVANPAITSGTLVSKTDPDPTAHPNTGVILIKKAVVADTTFTAPIATGCGPGGQANIAVDEAIDTAGGLPSASGNNSLTLDGTFFLALNNGQHQMAKILLSAFRASSASANVRQTPLRWSALSGLLHGRFRFAGQR